MAGHYYLMLLFLVNFAASIENTTKENFFKSERIKSSQAILVLSMYSLKDNTLCRHVSNHRKLYHSKL